ncbi:MAG: arylsulfatase [Sedimentisphaerales bacterium]
MNKRIKRREFLKAIGLGGVSLVIPGCSTTIPLTCNTSRNRPNIVLIMADDMGYSDLGCYGGEIQTPNLDKLAADGLRFTQFYNTARCCPTRASLMTGLYPHQTGMGWMTAANLGHKGYIGDLNNSCVTIAEVLKQAGYSTYMTGKWHLTYDKYRDGPKHNWPRQRGFERFYGTISGGGSYFKPDKLTDNNTRIQAPDEDYYYTDAISDNAVRFITEHRQSKDNEPFFLYVAYTCPHWPLHAKPEDIAKYRGKYIKGWDVLRAERHKRMLKMGIADKDWLITPRDKKVKTWDEVDQAKKELWDLRMAVYAAQIDCMDQGIGRIVSAVEQAGKLDNTLIVFLSDNGGCAEGISRKDKDIELLGTDDSFESYHINWANASNTPFRLYKHWVHEGGIATPLIAHWPARIKSRGELRPQPGHVIDIMATCIDIGDVKYPRQYQGNKIIPMEGKSLTPAFDNKPIKCEALYWEHESNRAIRIGKWKLVAKGKTGPWELYNLESDRTELNDVSGKYPARTKKMAAMWQNWAERSNVLPLDNRGWYERIEADRKKK